MTILAVGRSLQQVGHRGVSLTLKPFYILILPNCIIQCKKANLEFFIDCCNVLIEHLDENAIITIVTF